MKYTPGSCSGGGGLTSPGSMQRRSTASVTRPGHTPAWSCSLSTQVWQYHKIDGRTNNGYVYSGPWTHPALVHEIGHNLGRLTHDEMVDLIGTIFLLIND